MRAIFSCPEHPQTFSNPLLQICPPIIFINCLPGARHTLSTSLTFLLCCSVTKLCLTLGDPKDCSSPGFPVLHYLLEFAQTHVHWVGDTIQPSHFLSSPSPPALNLSQHQGLFTMSRLFTSSGQSIGTSAAASVFPMNIQGWFHLGWTGSISLLSKDYYFKYLNKKIGKTLFCTFREYQGGKTGLWDVHIVRKAGWAHPSLRNAHSETGHPLESPDFGSPRRMRQKRPQGGRRPRGAWWHSLPLPSVLPQSYQSQEVLVPKNGSRLRCTEEKEGQECAEVLGQSVGCSKS